MRVAFISFHTSPLATLGGKDTGGMNVYVRDAACELGRRGIAADIFTRSQGNEALRIDPRLGANVRVIHVPAGPQASHRLGSLASANGLIDTPPGAGWESGKKVEVLRLD